MRVAFTSQSKSQSQPHSMLTLPVVAPTTSRSSSNNHILLHNNNTITSHLSAAKSIKLCREREASTSGHSSTSSSHSEMSESEEGECCSDDHSTNRPGDQLESIVFSTLFGYQAIPVRIKILLSRALAELDDEDANAIIERAGWTRQDFQRGFIDEVCDTMNHLWFF
ncbi:unnamed protein product [Anisakis simplex]|uniref:SEC7 domain-containing protein n=1 Tax=Anisakis simplex TaxID=6269 RepID=A0A0M3JW00_ANISI|nr:unnamed protein product [Anisakis simplex]